MRELMLAVFVAVATTQTPQFPTPNPDAPPIVDMALRLIRAGSGGSSIARSASRGGETSIVYAGLGPCIVGAAGADPARANSTSWRASGRVRSVERGIAIADIEWQRIDYRPNGVTASPRVQTTLTLPLGERVAVDFIETPGSACRNDALVFEIGVALDHGTRLSMSSEGRAVTAGTVGSASSGRGGVARGGGGAGRLPTDTDEEAAAAAVRLRQGDDAARAAATITRPMPPREYTVDLWLADASQGSKSRLAQKLSKPIGGTGGRFEFPPDTVNGAAGTAVVDISALVIPVDGTQLIVAVTRRSTPSSGAAAVSDGWITVIPLPKAADVPSFEIPSAEKAYSLTLKIVRK